MNTSPLVDEMIDNVRNQHLEEAKEEKPIKQEDDEELWKLPKDGIDRVKSVVKLGFIVTCYAFAFISLVQLGFWLVKDHNFGPIIVHTDLISEFLVHNLVLKMIFINDVFGLFFWFVYSLA